jgi:ABC-type amino acid transport system permease subunit
MRPVWKWIIGIVVGLVVLAVIVGGVWVLTSRFTAMPRIVQNIPRVFPNPNNPNNPTSPKGPYYGQRGNGPYMMPFGGRGYPGMPLMGRRGGFGLFGIAGGLIGFLFFIGLVFALVLGIIWLVRRRPAMTTAAVAATVTPPSVAAVETHACANCGFAVQNGYEFCPNCGTKQ